MQGRSPENENRPEYIIAAAEAGFDVECDVWCNRGQFSLGHDGPLYPVNAEFLLRYNLWCHAKNIDAVEQFSQCLRQVHWFWHETDHFTLTSRGYVWVYPGKYAPRGSILVVSTEMVIDYEGLGGVCTDHALRVRREIGREK